MPSELETLRELSLNEALQLLEPAIIFTVGVAVYAILIFNLYRFMSRRDIFNLDFSGFEEAESSGFQENPPPDFLHSQVSADIPAVRLLLVRRVGGHGSLPVQDQRGGGPAADRHGGADLRAGYLLLHRGPFPRHCQDASLRPAGHIPDRSQIFRYLTASTELLNRVASEWDEYLLLLGVCCPAWSLSFRVTEPYLKALYNSHQKSFSNEAAVATGA